GFRSRYLAPGGDLGRVAENDVAQRMGADLEAGVEASNVRRRQGLALAGPRYVEGPLDAVLGQQLRHAQVQGMTVIPARRDVGRRFHALSEAPALAHAWSTKRFMA